MTPESDVGGADELEAGADDEVELLTTGAGADVVAASVGVLEETTGAGVLDEATGAGKDTGLDAGASE